MQSRSFRPIIIFLIGAITVSLLGYGVWTARPSVCAAPSPLKIMAVGDSITAGVQGNYRDLLWNQLTSARVKATFVGPIIDENAVNPAAKAHLGLYDRRINDLLPRMREVTAQYQPDVVLFMMGTNDAKRYDIEPSAKDLELVIDRIYQGKPNVALFIASVPPINKDLAHQMVKILNKSISDIVLARKKAGAQIYFVDQHSVLTLDDLFDGIHPNATGYEKIANTWYQAMCSTLGR